VGQYHASHIPRGGKAEAQDSVKYVGLDPVQTQDLKETQHLTLRNVKEKALVPEEAQERERNPANLITSLHY